MEEANISSNEHKPRVAIKSTSKGDLQVEVTVYSDDPGEAAEEAVRTFLATERMLVEAGKSVASYTGAES